VSCQECQELIVTAARDGRTLEAAAVHLARCGACWEFAKEAAVIASALASWRAPVPAGHAIDTAYAALLDRRGNQNRREATGSRSASAPMGARASRMIVAHAHPALLVLPGAAAVVAGLTVLPEWARVAVACWAAISAALVTLVLLDHRGSTLYEGE
jgi:hypothetical protein